MEVFVYKIDKCVPKKKDICHRKYIFERLFGSVAIYGTERRRVRNIKNNKQF